VAGRNDLVVYFGLSPSGREALRKCIDTSGLDDVMVDVTFDVSPDGVVDNLALLRWLDGTQVTGQAQTCMAAAFRLIRFPASDGGICRVRRRLETFLAP
jgi:hypothetical protein